MTTVIDLLAEPLHYGFMIRALAGGLLVGTLCGYLSVFLTLKGWALIGDALSHAVIPGVAIAYALGMPIWIGAFFAASLAGGAMLFLDIKTRLKRDVVIGLVFTSFLGLGLFILSRTPSAIDLSRIAFGQLTTINADDMRQIILIALVTLLPLIFLRRPLMLVFFDEAQAKVAAMPVLAMKILFFLALSLCVVAAMQMVGAFLVVALLIIPGAAAQLLSRSFTRVLILASAIGATCAVLGIYASYFLNANGGALIIVLLVAVFLAAYLSRGRRPITPARTLPNEQTEKKNA